MNRANDALNFAEQAGENQLRISAADAEEINLFGQAARAAYSTIRGIDTTGFEPAAIFVPTDSSRDSDAS